MSNKTEKKELLEKLSEISARYQQIEKIKAEMNQYEPEDHYSRKVTVPQFPGKYNSESEREYWEETVNHKEADALTQMDMMRKARYCPQKPSQPEIVGFEPPKNEETEKTKSKWGCFPVGAAFVAAIALLSLIGNEDELGIKVCWALIVVSLAIIAVTAYKMYCAKAKDALANAEAKKEYDRDVAEKTAKYKIDLKNYECAYESFRTEHSEFMNAYKTWRENYLAHLEEESIIVDKLAKDKEIAADKMYEEKFVPAKEQLDALNDLLPDEYLPVIHIIQELLRTNRADTLKEAMDHYDEMVYRERELQLQREQEAQRRREEEQRRRDEERRYQEEKQFREDQERQRRREEERRQQNEERRQQNEERRHREEMEQRDRQERDRQYQERRLREEEKRKAERAELERKQEESRATQRQCNTCALNARCTVAYTRANCASFRPR